MSGTPERTAGLVVLATCSLLISLAGLLFFGAMLLYANALYLGLPDLTVAAVVLLFGISLFHGVVAYGLWTWQSWAPDLGKWVYAAGVLCGLLSLPLFFIAGRLATVALLTALMGWMLYYVRRPKTTALFRPACPPGQDT